MFDLDSNIAALRRKDAEEIAASFPSTAFALGSARKAAIKHGNLVLAEMLDARLLREHPTKTNWLPRLAAWNDRLLRVLRAHKTNAQIEELRTARMSGRIDSVYLDEQYKALVDRFGWRTIAETVASEARQARDEATRDLERAITAATTDTTSSIEERLLFEAQADRAWHRLTNELQKVDAIAAATRIRDNIKAAGTPAERGWLYEEGLGYLRARDFRDVDEYMSSALAEAVPRVAFQKTELRHADFAAATAEWNARFTLTRIEQLPPNLSLESLSYFENQVLTRHFIPAERSDLANLIGKNRTQVQMADQIEQAMGEAGQR